MAIAGIFYIVTNGSLASVQVDKGLGWIVVTMITFAFMIIVTRFLGQRLEPFTITLYSNIIGLVVSVPFIFFWIIKI